LQISNFFYIVSFPGILEAS
jgi:hypothetical protein